MNFRSSIYANSKTVKIKIIERWTFEKIQFSLFFHTNIVCAKAAQTLDVVNEFAT